MILAGKFRTVDTDLRRKFTVQPNIFRQQESILVECISPTFLILWGGGGGGVSLHKTPPPAQRPPQTETPQTETPRQRPCWTETPWTEKPLTETPSERNMEPGT